MTLTPRQLQILKEIALGKPYKMIALETGISLSAVQRHATNAMLALKVTSKAELTHYALAKGIVRNLFS